MLNGVMVERKKKETKKENILLYDTTKYRLSNVCSTDCDLLDKYYDKTVWRIVRFE